MTRARWVGVAAAALTLVLSPSCDSPAEPRPEGDRVPIGQTIEESFSDTGERRFSFVATAGEYAVFLAALQGNVQLLVIDSAAQRVVAEVTAGPGSGPLELTATENFPALVGRVFHITVVDLYGAAGGRFRFLIYQPNPDPERRVSHFQFGDTVTGESLDGIADFDDFIVTGQAGQEFVAVAEALAAGSGMLGMLVYDSAGSYPILGSVFTPAGQSPSATTGRLRFFESRDHRFRFRTVIGPPQRYHGPYRFWTYRINRAPEHLSTVAPAGQVIVGEALDRAGDVDEFTISAPAGSEFNAFIHAGRAFHLHVVAGPGDPWADPFLAIAAVPADTSIFAHATGRFTLPPAGPYRLRVVGEQHNTPVADTGAFRLFVYPINRAPEHIAATITPGDTVSGEAIDMPGDVDEFTFAGAAGDEFNVLFEAGSASAQTQLRLEALDAAGAVVRVADGSGADTSLFQHVTGRFTLTANGTGRLRVRGIGDQTDRDVGPYRLFLHKVNRQPETQPAALAFPDSVFGETIEVPGDIDEFRVVVPDSAASSVVVQLGPDATAGLRVQLIDSASGVIVRGAAVGVPGGFGIDAGSVAPGTYILRVQGSAIGEDEQTLLRGSYSVWMYRYRFGPEVASDTIAIGDTVNGEAIDPVADVDRFWFYGEEGQHINLAFQGTAAAVTGGFHALLFAPHPVVVMLSATRTDSLGASQSGRFDLPYTGWYLIDVGGWTSSAAMGDRGPYRLAITAVPATPEQTGVTLAIGDSVVTEQVDVPGDVDEYTLVAPAGQMVALLAQRPSGGLHVLAFDSLSRDTLAWVLPHDADRHRRFTMPTSGRARIAVYEFRPHGLFYCGNPTCDGRYNQTGGFRLAVVAVNPAPETAPATMAIGDTLSESLAPGVDLDQFTGTGTPGEELSGWFRLESGPAPAGAIIAFEIVDPATGFVLRGGFGLIGSGATFYSSGSFRVPAGGTYVLRVRPYDETPVMAPYRFFFKREP